MTTVPSMSSGMSDEQQAIYYAQLGAVEKDEVAGVLLALFLGSFGLHHFYLGRNGLGVLYLLFFWTGIPGFLGFIECFFMPSRIKRYNLEQAMILLANIRGTSALPLLSSPVNRHCSSCGAAVMDGVRFCSKCGTALA